jgi:large subunit ribosomal protein L23
MLIPILTEKSIKNSKEGKYFFWVSFNLTKFQIKKLIEETFEVKVKSVRTMNYKALIKKNFAGKKRKVKAKKKAVVELTGKQKLDIFEEKK